MQLYYYDGTIEVAHEIVFEVVNEEKLNEWRPIFGGDEDFIDETRSSRMKFRTQMKVLKRTVS